MRCAAVNAAREQVEKSVASRTVLHFSRPGNQGFYIVGLCQELTRDRSERRPSNRRLAAGSKNQKIPTVVTHRLQDELTNVARLNN
jgi:hypothetical protein